MAVETDNPAQGTERALAVNLAAGRIAIGAGLWLAPRLSSRLLGFGEPDPRTLALSRIAGTRDLVLGGLQLSALEDRKRLSRITAAVAACDAGDTVAFALAIGNRSTRAAGIRGVVGAAFATAAGAWLAGQLGD
jgi:hypothetical protein